MTPASDSRVEIVDGHARIASVPQACEKCGSQELLQDPDVLDTWFSSGLWPFSTLGWPDETEDLRTFYPTSLLISGYDILFFWDARMVMLGLHLMPRETPEQRIPFRQLYLHALVRDPHGIKMSKTRGNVVDPLEIIEKHGTDALRFALAVMAAPGTDIALSEERILGYRAFANKIWNAARFLFFNLEKAEASGLNIEELAPPAIRERAPYATNDALPHRWIFSRLVAVAAQMNEALETFRFHEAAHVIYHFFWGDFCDWYIEWLKPQLNSQDRDEAVAAWRNLFAVFESALRLLHPFMPFLTEELWNRLPQRAGAQSISLERFPTGNPAWSDPVAEKEMALLQEIIASARNIRAEAKLDPKKRAPAQLSSKDPAVRELIARNHDALIRLGSLSELSIGQARLAAGEDGLLRSTSQFDLRIHIGEQRDLDGEIKKLKKEEERLKHDIDAKQQRLADAEFRSRAPENIVRGLEATVAERQREYQKIVSRLAELV